MALEKYFLYVDGTQRGPYTVSQVHHMVNNGIVPSESMFWCEGLEQWQPVTQLIVPKEEKIRRRFRLSARAVLAMAALAVLSWAAWPMIRQGWRELHQVEYTAEAAYWRARGVIREGLGTFTAVQFEEYHDGDVQMSKDQTTVRLGAQIKRLGGEQRNMRWIVLLKYDPRLKHWQPSPGESTAGKDGAQDPSAPAAP